MKVTGLDLLSVDHEVGSVDREMVWSTVFISRRLFQLMPQIDELQWWKSRPLGLTLSEIWTMMAKVREWTTSKWLSSSLFWKFRTFCSRKSALEVSLYKLFLINHLRKPFNFSPPKCSLHFSSSSLSFYSGSKMSCFFSTRCKIKAASPHASRIMDVSVEILQNKQRTRKVENGAGGEIVKEG